MDGDGSVLDANVTEDDTTLTAPGSGDGKGSGRNDQTADVVSDKDVKVEGKVKAGEGDAGEDPASSDSSQELVSPDEQGTSQSVNAVEVNELEAETQALVISDSDNSDHKVNCAVCDKVGVNHCKRCGKVNYCSRQHQVQDWKSHRAHCFPFEIRSATMADGKEGRYMFATRDIAMGEKLLTEKPLVFGPKSRYPFEIICLGCCSKISTLGDRKSGINVPCSKCKWMVCGLNCEKIPMHSDNECKLFEKLSITPGNNTLVQSVALYDTITVLRILLLKEKDEAKFNKLMSVSIDEASRRRGNQARYTTALPKQFIRDLCKLTEFTDETLDLAFDIVKSNCAAMCEISPGQPSSRYMGIFFENTVVFAPLCVSNMRWAIFPSKEPHKYSITTGASVDIKKGEMLSGEFTHYMTGTQVRRKVLNDQFFQSCSCRRCSDPTELGTYSSALRCLNFGSTCKTGYYLPVDPLNPNSEFKCDKCDDRVTSDKIITMISIVAKKLDQAYFINADPDDPTEDEEEVICDLEKELKSLKGKVLHPNHYLIVKTSYSISLRFMNVVAERSAGNVRPALAERVMEHCKSCLEMSNIFNPGHSRVRGRILYVLQLCMGIIVIGSINGKSTSRLTDAIRRYRKKKLEEMVAVQEECYKILEFEPNGTEEHIIRLTLKNQMEETQQILKSLFPKPSKK